MYISSLQNSKIKYVARLRNRHFRDKEGKTILEGYRALKRALDSAFPIIECFFCRELFLGENEVHLLDEIKKNGVPLYEVSSSVFAKFAYRDRPEGLIAVAECQRHNIEDLQLKSDGLYLVVENIEKPGNLGAILRSADGAGSDAVIICDKKTDIYNPNVITASTGTIFTMPIAEGSSQIAYECLKKKGIRILAADPHSEKNYYDTDMRSGLAVVLGAEQFGLSHFWKEHADLMVKIPMKGLADSLNVSSAATILLFEALRQREPKKQIETEKWITRS